MNNEEKIWLKDGRDVDVISSRDELKIDLGPMNSINKRY